MRIPVALAVLLFSTAVNATPLEDFTENMGYLIASEKLCELSYDKQAIIDVIAKNVPEDNVTFSEQLMINTSYAGIKIKDESKNPSFLIAHCAGISRIAKYYKLIK